MHQRRMSRLSGLDLFSEAPEGAQKMTLNHYMQPKKKHPVSLKTALKILRSRWYEGEINNFDKKLAATLNCNLEDAEKIRVYCIK